ncbi:zinc-dependent metalloprotease [Colwellia sp. 12G3]|uniref:zinc-dependent metalloprotease n=1 Tax=Colwellia sp. 12G3 TaxID=2058299 RepID=UPI000C331D46|nr:zinc-dependent metalloprotease [Colwellia sp. 12G3]PKI13197.1 peptidase [Colwellia sp. 12G3]
MNFVRCLMFLCICLAFTASAADLNKTNFADFIKDKTLQQGYFSFYHDEDEGKVYLQIEQFDQQFLFQSSLPHGIGSNDIGLDRGQLGDTRLVQFERVGDKVFLRQLNPYYRANSSNSLEQETVNEAFASSIIWGFKVIASSKAGNKRKDKSASKVLIDYTPFLLSDIHNITQTLKKGKQGNFKIDESRSGLYYKRTKAFPDNTELEATVTYKGTDAGKYLKAVTPDASAVTVNLHHSLIKLPDSNYQTRQFHPYSGYWSIDYADYASAIDEPLIKRLIPRHRLTKQDPKALSSVAVEPIVYYLDAGVPEPIRTALIDGAMWWQQAFSDIGYQDAFQVKILPEDADPMDVRYNVIQWVHRATRGWSYGSSVIDPRTGEIIKGHVTLGSLRVRQDYLIALGLTSPFTENDTGEKADTSSMKAMALARIRQLSAHEVGHTLGIAHNFAASVNDRASVMDYPHPYITLDEEGEIDLSQAYKENIGLWDKYVIAYGYGDYAKPAGASEEQQLSRLVKETQAKGFLYVSDADARPSSGAHNTGHLWDNGSNAAQELSRVMTVRAKALENFGLNSIAPNTPLSELEQALVPIYNFHRYQVEATAKLIAGVDYAYEVKKAYAVKINDRADELDNDEDVNEGASDIEEELQRVQAVSAAMQQQALTALLSTLDSDFLTLSEDIISLIPPKAYGYARTRESFVSQTGLTFDPISAAQASAKHTLTFLLNNERLARLQQQAAWYQKKGNSGQQVDAIFSVQQVITQLLNSTIKQSPETGLALLVQQRVNQQVVEQLLGLWHQKNLVTEVRSEVLASLTGLSDWLDDNHDSRRYSALTAQFILLEQQIKFSLEKNKSATPASKISMPPGSPIGG